MCGPELEFFNYGETSISWNEKDHKNPKPFTHGMFGYSVLRTGQNSKIFHSIFDDCEAFGVPLEGLHTETGPGVLEAAIQYSDAITAADNATLFKYALKIIGHNNGFMPCFMAKVCYNFLIITFQFYHIWNDIIKIFLNSLKE